MAASVPSRTEPVELDGIAANLMAAGATLGGRRVTRIVFEMEDGGVLERKFATAPQPVEQSAAEGLTQQEEEILQTLEESDFPLTRKDAASRLNLDSARGRFGIVVNKLVQAGLIHERGKYITDDLKKFPGSS